MIYDPSKRGSFWIYRLLLKFQTVVITMPAFVLSIGEWKLFESKRKRKKKVLRKLAKARNLFYAHRRSNLFSNVRSTNNKSESFLFFFYSVPLISSMTDHSFFYENQIRSNNFNTKSFSIFPFLCFFKRERKGGKILRDSFRPVMDVV